MGLSAMLGSFFSVVLVSAAAMAEPVILDVRTPKEFERSHVIGARNIDVKSESFEAEIAKLDKTQDYVVYCRSGKRSESAREKMAAAGFTSVRNLGSAHKASKELGVGCEGRHKRCQ